MAKTKTVTKTNKGTTSKTVKDTSKMSARQQIKSQKIAGKKELSKQATLLGAVGEGVSGATSTAISAIDADRQKNAARQQTYQAAIAKWNGILKSTPEAAEGTNPAMEGTSNKQGSNNNTGTNPDSDSWTPSGW